MKHDLPASMNIEVRNQTFAVAVAVADAYGSVQFQAEFGGKTVYDQTWEGLKAKLQEATKKAAVKLDLRFQRITHGSRPSIERGSVYVIHGGTGNPMVQWESGSKVQIESWRGGTFLKADAPAAEGLALAKAKAAADEAFSDWVEAWKFDLRNEVPRAVEAASGAAVKAAEAEA